MQVMHAYASIWMVMQVMYMFKCKIYVICKLCMLMRVYECLCKICICLNDMICKLFMFMQVCECLCKYVDAYASMWMLMQVMCMLKCMFNMLCKLWECLYASSTCYARYVYDNMQAHMQHVMQIMCMIICKFGLNVVGLIYAHICKLTSS